ncbi:hypothetical protein B0H14DRAFT_3594394, partial [Mycena olivaceomarginata]
MPPRPRHFLHYLRHPFPLLVTALPLHPFAHSTIKFLMYHECSTPPPPTFDALPFDGSPNAYLELRKLCRSLPHCRPVPFPRRHFRKRKPKGEKLQTLDVPLVFVGAVSACASSNFFYAALISEYYPLAALESQIARSGDAALKVSLLWPVYTADASHLDTLLEPVMCESNRWITARIEGDNVEDKWFRSLAPIRGRITRLERLKFVTTGLNKCDLFAVAPRLREIVLTDDSDRCVSLPVVAPWSQITHLRATWKIEILLKVINATPNLVSYGLNLWLTSYDPLPTPVRPTVLPRLRTLYVGDDRLFDLLETPDLRHLFVGGVGLMYSAPAFLRRSGCHLTSLTAQNPQAAVFIPLLDTLPTLRALHVSFQAWYSTADRQRFVAGMTVVEPDPVRYPNLVSLRIGWDARGDYTAVLAM